MTTDNFTSATAKGITFILSAGLGIFAWALFHYGTQDFFWQLWNWFGDTFPNVYRAIR